VRASGDDEHGDFVVKIQRREMAQLATVVPSALSFVRSSLAPSGGVDDCDV